MHHKLTAFLYSNSDLMSLFGVNSADASGDSLHFHRNPASKLEPYTCEDDTDKGSSSFPGSPLAKRRFPVDSGSLCPLEIGTSSPSISSPNSSNLSLNSTSGLKTRRTCPKRVNLKSTETKTKSSSGKHRKYRSGLNGLLEDLGRTIVPDFEGFHKPTSITKAEIINRGR